MLLHDSRSASRKDADGKMISLEFQNRKRWDKNKIEEGSNLLKKALMQQKVGVYQIQAAISALHAESASWDQTDWAQINALYELLFSMNPSSVVRVNQSIAMSYAVSVESALELLESLKSDQSMSQYQPYFTARADLHYRLGNYNSARSDLTQAIKLTDNEARQDFLKNRIEQMSNRHSQ